MRQYWVYRNSIFIILPAKEVKRIVNNTRELTRQILLCFARRIYGDEANISALLNSCAIIPRLFVCFRTSLGGNNVIVIRGKHGDICEHARVQLI